MCWEWQKPAGPAPSPGPQAPPPSRASAAPDPHGPPAVVAVGAVVSPATPASPRPNDVCNGYAWLMSSKEDEERNVKRVGPARPDLVVMSTTPAPAREP